MNLPPAFYFLPSHLRDTPEWSTSSSPLLIVSDTPAELVTFAITFAQHSHSNASLVLITSQDRSSFVSSLIHTSVSSPSSPLNSSLSILASDTITVYHVDTLAHLRVLLSSLQHSEVGFLGVDSFISLHEAGSELSAQGISRTLAAMIDIASSSNGVLAIRETSESIERTVPVLNPGVGRGLSQATVSVTRILGRWIRGVWNQEANVEGDYSAEWTSPGERWDVQWTFHDGEVDNIQFSIR